MKRIATIQDISCVGKCSLTVALPIISAAGIETAVIPTAVLSTHTAFKNFTFHDLTDEISIITNHWKNEGFLFDGIYTGYLGSIRQLEIVSDFISDFKSDKNTVIIDPVMGDGGKLYPGFTKDFSLKMRKLCSKADIIVPNLTEAAFLTETEYLESYDENDIKLLLKKLSEFCSGTVILTGVSFDDKKLGIMSYNKKTSHFFSYFSKHINVAFHGTGDIFASAFCGAVINGISIENALKIAVDYTVECIRLTICDKKSVWYGVNFEKALPYYIKLLNNEI